MELSITPDPQPPIEEPDPPRSPEIDPANAPVELPDNEPVPASPDWRPHDA